MNPRNFEELHYFDLKNFEKLHYLAIHNFEKLHYLGFQKIEKLHQRIQNPSNDGLFRHPCLPKSPMAIAVILLAEGIDIVPTFGKEAFSSALKDLADVLKETGNKVGNRAKIVKKKVENCAENCKKKVGNRAKKRKTEVAECVDSS